MIRAVFRAPGYKCVISDQTGSRFEWVMAGDSKVDVQERLLERLQYSDYDLVEIKAFDFKQWLDKADVAKQDAIETVAGGSKPDFDSKIWSQLKQHLFELFNGKCAYCESRVLHVASGDVEHYRPKKGVTGVPDHPGYYWTAYDTANFLPACEQCNRVRGKRNHFPVKGFRAYRPEEHNREEPLLLNPYVHDPGIHLKFIPGQNGMFTGRVEGVTDEGKKSVEVYNLNRPYLVEERRKAQEEAEKHMILFATNQPKFKEIVAELQDGVGQYSLAALQQLNASLDQCREILNGGG